MGLKIAIGGKGGVGKTTVCAVWAQLFADDGFEVLAIDADPNTNLALAFGMPSEQNPQSLVSMKELIAERTGSTSDSVGGYFRLNPKVSDLPEKYWVDVNGVKLLVLGAITHAGAGCACPEGAFLKAMLSHTMLQRKEIVLIDLAAGVEFMGRASIQGIDALAVVTEPGRRSIETANNIAQMGQELGISTVAAIANKVSEPAQLEAMRSQLNMPVLAAVDYSLAIQQADFNSVPAFESGGELVNQLRNAKTELAKLMKTE